MGVRWWITETLKRSKSDGISGLLWGVEKGYHKLAQLSGIVREDGENIWQHEWDLLIIVDGCRYDLMTEVEDDFDFITNLTSSRSVNSVTRLWMAENFSKEFADEMEETVYISANPWSESELRDEDFESIEHIWKSAWTEPGTVPPEVVTDHAIRAGRDQNPSRMIVHYMQPHAPFIPAPNIGPGKDLNKFGDQPEGDVWDALKEGDVSIDEVWPAYRENLRVALSEVQRLLDNYEADSAIVTSDHGNLVGEWGIYGHHPNMPFDGLRKIPLIKTSATDGMSSNPDVQTKAHDIDRDEQLQALGYK